MPSRKKYFGTRKRNVSHVSNINRMNTGKNTGINDQNQSNHICLDSDVDISSNQDDIENDNSFVTEIEYESEFFVEMLKNEDYNIKCSSIEENKIYENIFTENENENQMELCVDMLENNNTYAIEKSLDADYQYYTINILPDLSENENNEMQFHPDSEDYDNQSESSDYSLCSDLDTEDDDCGNECFFSYEGEEDGNLSNDEDSDEEITSLNDDFGDDEDIKFPGNRIVDLNHIFTEIRAMNMHSKTCNFNDMRLAKQEVKKGFVSYLRFVCRKCKYIKVIRTSQHRKDQFDLNYECVLASMLIGIGHSQLEEFFGVLDVPCMTPNSYSKKLGKVHEDLTCAVAESNQIIADEEINYAKQMGNVDQNGMALVKGVIDAAWGKRSYRTNYSALSGSAVIIGHHTQKVLWQGVADKFCSICKKIATDKIDHYEHNCNMNYIGPSTGMEPKLIIDGCKALQQNFGIRIHEVIGDGDSSVLSDLHKANIYQNPTLKTVKIECSNHLFRNGRGNMRKLGEKGPLKPYMTAAKIEEIIKAIRCARKHWVEEDISMEEKIEHLRNDIYNIPFHVFGSHENCKDYFCKKKDLGETNFVDLMKSNSSFNSILDSLSRMRLNARSILLNENTNVAEQFNSLIVKYTGGKRINFSKSKSFSARTKLAVLQHNTGRAYSSLCEHMKMKPNSTAARIEFKRLVKKLWHNNRKRPYQPKTRYTGIDRNYGTSTCATPDMDEETFIFEKEKFLNTLSNNQAKRSQIQSNTQGQNESSEWKQYRANMLTASNFGRVCCCRSPQSYTGIVNSILYTDISNLKQVAHGSFYEKNAIKKLEDSEGITVYKCGLFIDEKLSFLGATPDGIVGDKAIVEVKCPLSIYEKDIEEAILNGKLNVWSRSRKSRKKGVPYIPTITGINHRHKWYFQVQGQLHVTQKEFCYFVVWVGDDYPIRIEKIYRDDNFWKQMEEKLKNFYHTALLRELVDPRMARNMPLRKFDKSGNFIC